MSDTAQLRSMSLSTLITSEGLLRLESERIIETFMNHGNENRGQGP